MEDDPWASAAPAGPSSPRPASPGQTHASVQASEINGLDDLSLADPADPFAASSSPVRLAEPSIDAAVNAQGGMDDFDEFDEPASGGPSGAALGDEGMDDEGFGDFGDFEEGDFEEAVAVAPNPIPPQVPADTSWTSLHLESLPDRADMLAQLSDLLSPLLQPSADVLTDAHPRQTGGLTQVMVADREAYLQLTAVPTLKPLDWVRSRTRRDHLISMGVPVNLDEVDSHRLTSLPPLRINMLPPTPQKGSSATVPAPPGPTRRFSSEEKGKGRDISPNALNGTRLGNGRPSSLPAGGALLNGGGQAGGPQKYGLGMKPEMDMSKAEELCGLEEDQLSILPLDRLQIIQKQLVDNSAQASALLAWLLQLKDAQTQDAATYNGMISEVISNAAKAKSAQATSGGVFRRASGRKPTGGSEASTPRRVASPAMR